ncbi:MAG: membrane protein insertase YidC [Armatimonadetes bacterium]|nr:membrane protein insertase YidC [Armatimonadota bacterium]
MTELLSNFFMAALNGLQFFTGSYAWAILLFTVAIKVLLYPLTEKQYRSMKEMQALQPEMRLLQEKYKNDSKRLQEEQQKLFTKHQVNPLGGCLPLFIQMPILYGIYTTIMNFKHVFEGEHISFLWMGSGSYLAQMLPDWYTVHAPALIRHFFPSFAIAKSLAEPDVPLLILYGISMYLSQKLTVTDPATAKQQASLNLIMPIMFTFMLYSWNFPSAMVLYWLSFNLLGLIQQAHIIRMPATLTVRA